MDENTKKLNEEENEDVEDQEEQDDAGKDNGDKGDKGGTGKGGSGKGGGRKFSQEEVTRMTTREKQQGRNSVFNELGIKPGDQKQIDAIKAFIKSQKSDEQLALEKDQESQSKIAEANQRALVAEAKAEAMMLGVKAQFVEDAVTLVLSKIDVNDEKADMKSALGELKTKYPVWFEEGDDDENDDGKGNGGAAGKKTGQKGTGTTVKADKNKDKGGTEKSLGQRLAAQRKNSTPKKSFWS